MFKFGDCEDSFRHGTRTVTVATATNRMRKWDASRGGEEFWRVFWTVHVLDIQNVVPLKYSWKQTNKNKTILTKIIFR